jgi:L-fucose mutarotase/ribose pyranase (RbsD/FucU family)
MPVNCLFQVFFADPDTDSIKTGWVCVNDPFLCQFSVWTDKENKDALQCVKYHQLRSSATIPKNEAEDDDDELADGNCEPAPKQARATRTENQPAEPQIDILSLVQCDNTENVQLTYAPCCNGVLKKNMKAMFAGNEFRIDHLEFDICAKEAFARLTRIDNEKVTARMPAVLVELTTEDYLKNEIFDFNNFQESNDKMYGVLSSIKRAIGLSRKKTSHTWSIAPASKLTRTICGFKTDSAKENVRHPIIPRQSKSKS